jgi:hypothetical protein
MAWRTQERCNEWHREYHRTDKSRAYQKAWKAANKEKVKEVGRQYYARHRDRILVEDRAKRALESEKRKKAKWGADYYRNKSFDARKKSIVHRAKQNAKQTGREFSITVNDLQWPTHCPVLGIELNYGAPINGRRSQNSPSIDRHDSSKGYVPGNCVIMSWRANRIKCDATTEEVHRLLIYLCKERSH